jgi:hypothetical protein
MSDEKFDFKHPYKSADNFDEYVEQSTFHLKNRIESLTTHSQLRGFIALLVVVLVSLGLFTYFQSRGKDASLADLNTKATVAGITEEEIQNIVSGDTFSIILTQPTPKGFKMTKQVRDSKYLAGKKAIVNLFESIQKKDQNDVINLIEIEAVETDGAKTGEEFAQFMSQKLGTSFEIREKDIEIPKAVKLTKILENNNTGTTAYYTTKTEENYYVIRVVNQSVPYPDLSAYTEFTNSFIPGLYLN